MSRTTLFDTWCFGRDLNNESIKEVCLDFAARNFEWLTEQAEFWQFSKADVNKILQDKNVNSRGMEQIDAIKKWYKLKRDPAPTKYDFKELLQSVNWSTMTEDNLMDIMESLDDKQLR